MKQIFHFLMFALLSLVIFPSCLAATLHGSVYDADLKKVDNAVLEVNSVPMQRVLSQNGSYSFELSPGDYVITAVEKQGNYTISSSSEDISIKEEGTFVYDIFLFPSLDEDVLDEIGNTGVEDLTAQQGISWPVLGMIFVIGIAVIILFVVLQLTNINSAKNVQDEKKPSDSGKNEKKEDKEESLEQDKSSSRMPKSDIDELLALIKEQGGRTTQKELRKKMPHSEAKISLMLTELEHKGKIERIKKGRGNIIVLR